jgi:DNA topoisomerase-1
MTTMSLLRKAPAKKTNGIVKSSRQTRPRTEPKARLQRQRRRNRTLRPKRKKYRWWEDPTKGDGTDKWTTLEHNGVVFPLHTIHYQRASRCGTTAPVTLAPEAEEVAGFFGAMLNSTHNVENLTFQKNFFEDFRAVLDKTGGAKDRDGNKIKIKEFAKCDFKPIFEYYDAKRTEKKALPAAEKKALKSRRTPLKQLPILHVGWSAEGWQLSG